MASLVLTPFCGCAIFSLTCHHEILTQLVGLCSWHCSSEEHHEHFIHQLSRYRALGDNPLISKITLFTVWYTDTNTSYHKHMHAPHTPLFPVQYLWHIPINLSYDCWHHLHPGCTYELYILSTFDSSPINKDIGRLLPLKSHPDTLSLPALTALMQVM